jgi:hypothetical protein
MSEKGISVSTFGVGHHFDEELMMMVAGGGGGNYRYLGDPERIVAALTSEFHTASRTAASEVEIIIRLKRDCRFGSVVGRDWRRDGDSYIIRLGDLSAGERRTVFANLNVAGERPGLREVGEVALPGDFEGGHAFRAGRFPRTRSGRAHPSRGVRPVGAGKEGGGGFQRAGAGSRPAGRSGKKGGGEGNARQGRERPGRSPGVARGPRRDGPCEPV